jgi:hypothetical protein
MLTVISKLAGDNPGMVVWVNAAYSLTVLTQGQKIGL